MRLSAEVFGLAEQRQNPLGERELVLRGLAIPAIEHLQISRDAFDAIDFTDNRISRLGNFPRLLRLRHLLLPSNVIESVDAANLAKNVPNLHSLVLSQNQINSLYEVSNLGKAFPKLEFLSLVGNPVTRRQHYRLYAINHIPTLRVLDMVKISKTERDRAERLAKSAAGAALEKDVHLEAREPAKTFVPGEGHSAEESFATSFTPEQKEQIRQMVANAKSPAEIEQIELSVQRGVFPSAQNSTVSPTGVANGVNGDDDPKRPAEDAPSSDSKRARTD